MTWVSAWLTSLVTGRCEGLHEEGDDAQLRRRALADLRHAGEKRPARIVVSEGDGDPRHPARGAVSPRGDGHGHRRRVNQPVRLRRQADAAGFGVAARSDHEDRGIPLRLPVRGASGAPTCRPPRSQTVDGGMLREVRRGERRAVRTLAGRPLLVLPIGAGRHRRSPPSRDDRHGDHRFGEGASPVGRRARWRCDRACAGRSPRRRSYLRLRVDRLRDLLVGGVVAERGVLASVEQIEDEDDGEPASRR